MCVDAAVGNERTALSWQRTALAMVAGSAIVARLTFDRLGFLAALTLILSLPVGAWILLASQERYQRHASTHRGGRSGRAPLALAVATTAVGVTGLTAILKP